MTQKQCKYCKQMLDRKSFYRLTGSQYKSTWDCRDSFCKECRTIYQTERRKGIKLSAIEYKGGKCEDCAILATKDNQAIFDFHHLDPTQKEISFGKTSLSLEKLKPELERCVLLCANCHRLRHYQCLAASKPTSRYDTLKQLTPSPMRLRDMLLSVILLNFPGDAVWNFYYCQ